MAFHQWGDKDFSWSDLNDCVNYMDYNLKKWGRMNVRQTKEKFGCLRCYCHLGWYSLMDITHPGYSYYPYPKWLVTLDIYCFSKVIPFLFNWFIYPYHCWLYRKFYSNAVKKWPHLREEILCCADFSNLLKDL